MFFSPVHRGKQTKGDWVGECEREREEKENKSEHQLPASIYYMIWFASKTSEPEGILPFSITTEMADVRVHL